jgi:hypothetical protein
MKERITAGDRIAHPINRNKQLILKKSMHDAVF